MAKQGDVRDRASLTTALQAGLDEFGRLDIVVANAGIAPMQSGDDGWRDVIDVNLTGVYNTIEVAIPTMVEQGTGGSIVLISSAAGLAGIGSADAGSIGYAAAKHGLVGLMRVYANLLAPQSIRVNSIHPSGVDTPMINNEFTRQWLADLVAAIRCTAGHGQRAAGGGAASRGHRQRGGMAGVRPGTLHHRRHVAGRCGLLEQEVAHGAKSRGADRLRPDGVGGRRTQRAS